MSKHLWQQAKWTNPELAPWSKSWWIGWFWISAYELGHIPTIFQGQVAQIVASRYQLLLPPMPPNVAGRSGQVEVSMIFFCMFLLRRLHKDGELESRSESIFQPFASCSVSVGQEKAETSLLSQVCDQNWSAKIIILMFLLNPNIS